MSVYRYIRRAMAEAGAAEASSAVEVTLTNPQFKAELDRTMDRMGFEFAGSREEYPSAMAPGFPTAWGGSAGSGAEPHGDAFMDRPTPVAGLSRGGQQAGRGPLGDLDAAALGILPSWEGLPRVEPGVMPSPASRKDWLSAARLPDVFVRARRWAWVAALAAPILVVHGGTLGTTPAAEELIRLYDGAAHGFVAAVVKQEGVHALPLSRLFVWTLHQVFGLHPGVLFLFALFAHVACAALLRQTLASITKRPVLATAIAGLWAISPLHRGTLDSLYSFGTVGATAMALVVLSGIVTLHEQGLHASPRRLLGWNALLVLGALSADTGTAFALALPLFVPIFVPRGEPGRRIALWLLPALAVSLGIYVGARLLGPPEPLGRFLRGLPLFLEYFAYGLGNLFVGPFVVVGPAGEPSALIGSPGASASVVLAIGVSLLVVTAVAWALARQRAGLGRRVAAFASFACAEYLFAAFDGAKFVVRDGVPAIAVQPEPHYSAMLCLAICVGLVAASAKPLVFRQPMIAPAIVAASSLFLTLLAWPAASNIEERKASIEKGVEDAERALERAIGATEEGKDAYFENVDLWFVPRQIVGRNRLRFAGLFSYFAVAHSGGAFAGRPVHFVEADAKLVAQIRETVRPKIASLIESGDEARQKGHAITTPRLSRATAPPAASPGAAGSASRRAPRTTVPRGRKPLPFKPGEAPK